MRVLLSGGGTAGHVYPALTVAELMRGSGLDEVAFVGTPEGLEARLVCEAGIEFFPLAARGFDRGRPWSLPGAVAVLLASTARAWRLLGKWRPDVVVGFGGYVSLPVGVAAAIRRVPLVLHEQNSIPGMANKALSRFARVVAITYPVSSASLSHPERAQVTGNPVRRAVLEAGRAAGRSALGQSTDDLVMLVFGGSRGARHLNEAVVSLYRALAEIPRLRVLHAAGALDLDAMLARLDAAESAAGDRRVRYSVVEYLDDMPSALASADLVVARAGATSIAEITAVGRAAVLVPYPYATDDHQTLNARAVEAAGACIMVEDRELDDSAFSDAVVGLLESAEARARMAAASSALGRRDAADRVAALVREAGTHGSGGTADSEGLG